MLSQKYNPKLNIKQFISKVRVFTLKCLNLFTYFDSPYSKNTLKVEVKQFNWLCEISQMVDNHFYQMFYNKQVIIMITISFYKIQTYLPQKQSMNQVPVYSSELPGKSYSMSPLVSINSSGFHLSSIRLLTFLSLFGNVGIFT